MFDPPSLPPAGWYPDPHSPGRQRWWDGRDWTEQWTGSPPLREHTPAVGEWLSHSFSQALSRWRAVAAIALLTAVPGSIFLAIAARYGLDGLAVRDEELVGWSNDRLPGLLVLGLLAMILTMLASVGISVIMLRTEDGEQPGRTTGDEFKLAWSSIGQTVRVLPRLIGWGLLLMLVVSVAMLCLALIAIASGGAGVLLMLVLFPLALYFGLKLAFFIQAVIDRPGNPYRRSARAVAGRWWPVFGRLLLLGLITSIISAMLQSAGTAASGNGFGASFNQTTIETDRAGRVVDFELSELYPVDVWWIVFGSIASIAIAVLSTAVIAAGMAALYRSYVAAES